MLVNSTLPFALDSVATGAGPRYAVVDEVTWDFGDGSPVAHGWQVSHRYASPAPVRVRCTVTNNLFCSTTAELFPFGPTATAAEHPPGTAVAVFPNPSATGAFTVRGALGATYAVVDATGRTVAAGTATGPETVIDLSAHATGVYALRLTWPDGRLRTRRLVRW